jgi:hypothetical protein
MNSTPATLIPPFGRFMTKPPYNSKTPDPSQWVSSARIAVGHVDLGSRWRSPAQGTDRPHFHMDPWTPCGLNGQAGIAKVTVARSRGLCGLVIKDHNEPTAPLAYRLYLPKEWAEDAERWKKARVPEEIEFKTKPQIARDQLRAACAAVPRGVVLKDSSYGSNSALSAGVANWGSAMWLESF